MVVINCSKKKQKYKDIHGNKKQKEFSHQYQVQIQLSALIYQSLIGIRTEQTLLVRKLITFDISLDTLLNYTMSLGVLNFMVVQTFLCSTCLYNQRHD